MILMDFVEKYFFILSTFHQTENGGSSMTVCKTFQMFFNVKNIIILLLKSIIHIWLSNPQTKYL